MPVLEAHPADAANAPRHQIGRPVLDVALIVAIAALFLPFLLLGYLINLALTSLHVRRREKDMKRNAVALA